MSNKDGFELHGTGLVTGASSGLGIQYADFLARNGLDLVLVARSEDALNKVADDLRQRFGVQVTVLPTDLSDAAARQGLLDELAARDQQIDLLINNAGFGTHGRFAEIPVERVQQEVELNCVTLTHLTRALLPAMLERRYGAIVNVASTGSFQPIPTMAVYAATKVYVRSFTEALWFETKGTGVRVTAINPGPTETAFFANTGEPNSMTHRRTPEQVIQTTFRALNNNNPSVVDGEYNRVQSWVAKIAPAKIALPLAQRYVAPKKV